MSYYFEDETKQFNLHISSKDRISGNNNDFIIDWSNTTFSKNKSYLVGVTNISFPNNIIQNKLLSFQVVETSPALTRNITITDGSYSINEIVQLIQNQLSGMTNTYLITFDSSKFVLNIQASNYVTSYRLQNPSDNAITQLGITDLTLRLNSNVYSFGDLINLISVQNLFICCDKITNENFNSSFIGKNILLKLPLSSPRNSLIYYSSNDVYFNSSVIANPSSQGRFYLLDDSGNLITYKGEFNMTLYFIPLK